MANFAKAQLMKYGWTEGKGLGKDENGITQALRPKLKFDTAGVGHRDSNWNEWWETAFNDAADNIQVKSVCNEILISVSKGDNVLSHKEKSTPTYGNFLKTSTLYGNDLVEENNCTEMERVKLEKDNIIHTIPLTDEELFKACGGRTAHKGARHGLRLSGKLQRIDEQERRLLNIYRDNFCKTGKDGKESEGDEWEIKDIANTALSSMCSLDKLDNSHTSIESSVNTFAKKKQIWPVDDLTQDFNDLCDKTGIKEEAKSNGSHNWVNDKKQLKRKRRKEKRKKGDGTSDISMRDTMERKRFKREDCGEESEVLVDVLSREQITVKDPDGKELDCPMMCNSKKKKGKRRKIRDCQSSDTVAMEMNDQEAHSNQDTMKEAKKSSKHKSNKCLKATRTEAEKLNGRIEKKKRVRFHRRQESRLHNLTESIKAISFDAEQTSDNMAENNMKVRKKLSKKAKKAKKAKKEKKILKLSSVTEAESMLENF